MPQQQMYSAIANSPGTELSAAITATTTTISILSGSTLPDGPNIITIGSDETSETVLYTSKSGNSLIGCTRGFGGTTAKAWAAASRVARYYTAYDHEAFRKNLTDLSGVTSESTTDIVLSAGQQILNATKNARLQGLKVQGRTLIDLLGGAGSGENLTGWAQSGVAVTTSTTQKRSGNSSFKVTPTGAQFSYIYRDFNGVIDNTKNYIIGVWVYIESNTGGAPKVSICDSGTFGEKYIAPAVTSVVGSWQFVFSKIPPNSTLTGSGVRVIVGSSIAAAGVFYIDEIRLYAVSAADYAAIGNTITGEAIDRILPYVPPGINGVDGLWVRRYGKNLLPSVPDTLHANAKMNGPYDMVLNATANSQSSLITMPAQPNTAYFISGAFTASTGAATLNIFSVDANGAMTYVAEVNNAVLSRTFNTPASCVALRFNLFGTVAGTFTFKDWFLKIGSTAETFQPREDSLIAFGGVDLHANPNDGSEPDILREVNGRYEVVRPWRKMVLTGLQDWTVLSTHTGYKRLRSLGIAPTLSDSSLSALVKFDGKVLTQTFSDVPSSAAADVYRTSASGNTTVTVSSADSGWGDSYTPAQAEIQAYFYGWIMGYDNAGSFATPYNGTGAKRWRAIVGDTSSGVATMPIVMAGGGYTPYQLLHRLASPTLETVQEDGALSLLEGDNFIEVGSGYVSRESVKPVYTGTTYNSYNINNVAASAKLKYKALSILSVFRDSKKDQSWSLLQKAIDDYGIGYAIISAADYDLAASYSSSYIKLDKSPVPVVAGFYAATEKAQLHDLIDAVTEISSAVSTLAVKKSEKDAPGWIAPTLLNGFTALFSSRVPSYRKVNGVVEFTGALKFTSSMVNSNLVIFRLPEGYRPKDQLDFGVLSGSGANRVFGGLEIMPTGEVYVLSGMGGDAIFLDGLPTFRVD